MADHDKDMDNGMEDEDDGVVILVDEDGNEHEFVIVSVMPLGDASYAILEPLEEDEDEEPEFVAMRIGVDEEGDDVLLPLEDEEYDRVYDAYVSSMEEGIEDGDEIPEA